jgi:glycosyltransferase involved in cell wall biosynthesis
VKPLVSVLIPHYNYIQYVPFAIDSALAQTYPNVEVVVTDNQSTDGAVAILRDRYRDEPRVRIIENERNLGMTGNFNRALEHARGEYILWMSADDFMLPAHVERLQAVFEREPKIDVVYSGVYFADEAGRIHSIRALPGQLPVDYVDVRDELVEQITTVCPLCLPAALFPRTLLDEAGPLADDEYLASDWEYAIRLAMLDKRFAHVADPSVVIRLHTDQRSGNDYHTSGRNVVDFVAYLHKFFNHEGMRRMHGRERRIIGLLDALHGSAVAMHGGNPFTPEAEARFADIRQKLLDRVDVHNPATVRSCLVSVIVEAVGPPQSVLRAIDSVHAQTFSNVELVVVDHGAFPLENILRAHPAWSRIAYLRHPVQLQPGAAKNYGLRMARGEYLAFLGPDNRFDGDHLESLVATIERERSDIAIASSRLTIEHSSPQFTLFQTVGLADVFHDENDDPVVGTVANGLPLDAVLFYRGLHDRVGRFNEALPVLDDFEFSLRWGNARRAWSHSRTLFVHVRLGFAGQLLRVSLSNYVHVLDQVYAAYPALPAVANMRAQHRARVVAALETVNASAAGPQGMAEFMATLAGRAVVPSATPSPA